MAFKNLTGQKAFSNRTWWKKGVNKSRSLFLLTAHIDDTGNFATIEDRDEEQNPNFKILQPQLSKTDLF